jgi:hypothetical protein
VIVIKALTDFSPAIDDQFFCARFSKIARLIAIVVEAAQNLNRAFFPLKSKAKNFDGSTVGL